MLLVIGRIGNTLLVDVQIGLVQFTLDGLRPSVECWPHRRFTGRP